MCYKILFHLNILLGLSSCVWFAYSFTYEKSFKVCSDFWPLIVVTWPVRLTGRNNPMTDLTPSLLCVHVRCMRGNKMQKLKSCSFFLTSMWMYWHKNVHHWRHAGLSKAWKILDLQACVYTFYNFSFENWPAVAVKGLMLAIFQLLSLRSQVRRELTVIFFW